jgi:FkbM family methyltransferase
VNVRAKSCLWRRLVRISGRLLFRFAENNDDPRMEKNGEAWLLRSLLAAHQSNRTAEPFVVIDGGANRGDYSRMVLWFARKLNVEVDVHAFEPAPICIAELREYFFHERAFRLIGKALGDRIGDAVLYDGGLGSSQASLVARAGHRRDSSAIVQVSLVRLDDYLKSNSITRVSLLKLDIEGGEVAALRGLGESLRPEIVDAIQFEYGGATLDAGTTLKDLYSLLEARGYILSKLLPSAVELRSYSSWMENYAYSNYVALSPRWGSGKSTTN